ncbi:hypothetical protein TWF696_003394 [Orbilia brochopaga]|uniref:Uncharacterized protein n=1 Tax=Orbilia brochopaga TaxID=3140254 RepID=A0AAV9U1S2_9PEZI
MSFEFTFTCPAGPAPVQRVATPPPPPPPPAAPAVSSFFSLPVPVLSPVRFPIPWGCETSASTEIKATRIAKDGTPLPPRARQPKPRRHFAVMPGIERIPRVPKLNMAPASFWVPMSPPTRFTWSTPRTTPTPRIQTLRPFDAYSRDTFFNRGVETITRRSIQLAQLNFNKKRSVKLRKELDDLSTKWQERQTTTTADIWTAVKTTATVAVGVCKALGWPFVGYLVMEALQR